MLPGYHVVEYLGVQIPSRSEYTNYNNGLKLSYTPDGIGLYGTVEKPQQSDLFKSCERDSFEEEKYSIAERMKSWLENHIHIPPASLTQGGLEKYSLIFHTLGQTMSEKQILNLNCKNYIPPKPGGGLLTDEDLNPPGYSMTK